MKRALLVCLLSVCISGVSATEIRYWDMSNITNRHERPDSWTTFDIERKAVIAGHEGLLLSTCGDERVSCVSWGGLAVGRPLASEHYEDSEVEITLVDKADKNEFVMGNRVELSVTLTHWKPDNIWIVAYFDELRGLVAFGFSNESAGQAAEFHILTANCGLFAKDQCSQAEH